MTNKSKVTKYLFTPLIVGGVAVFCILMILYAASSSTNTVDILWKDGCQSGCTAALYSMEMNKEIKKSKLIRCYTWCGYSEHEANLETRRILE
jgi:hypothetical protein